MRFTKSKPNILLCSMQMNFKLHIYFTLITSSLVTLHHITLVFFIFLTHAQYDADNLVIKKIIFVLSSNPFEQFLFKKLSIYFSFFLLV